MVVDERPEVAAGARHRPLGHDVLPRVRVALPHNILTVLTTTLSWISAVLVIVVPAVQHTWYEATLSDINMASQAQFSGLD